MIDCPITVRRSFWPCVVVFIVAVSGCHVDTETNRVDSAEDVEAAVKKTRISKNDGRRESGQIPREDWYSIRMRGAKVGHAVIRVQRDSADTNLIYWRSEEAFTLLRNNDRLQQNMILESWEDKSGRIRKWRWSESSTGVERTCQGEATNGGFLVTLGDGPKTLMPWKTDWRGFFGDYQLLSGMSLQAGQVGEFRGLIPLLNQVGKVTAKVIGLESVDTMLGRQELTRIDFSMLLASQPLQSTYWVDTHGDVVKQSISQFEIIKERTVKEIALAPNDDFDLYAAFNVSLGREIPDVHEKSTIRYRVKRRSGDPLKGLFVDDHSQSLTRNSDGSLTVRVRRVGKNSKIVTSAVNRPTDGDLSGNSLVEVDHPIIQEMADSVARNGTDPMSIATELEALVHRRIRNKNLSQGFNSAATTAKLLEGDCTEHAVLLAALCRARKIPARVAIGLIYFDGRMAYHMWNEVWVSERWVPMDATLGRGYVGPGHIKTSVSNLDGIAPFAAMIPLLQLIGDLQIQIEDVQ
jgi:transglutaminase-like putative cysteine protease